jgi:DNA repair ATPase RecN
VDEIRDARRVDEIAQMLGSITDATRDSAAEMLARVRVLKN